MSLEFIRILVDTGMLILIWLVQLVIYPGFTYYATEDLISWHKKYTTRISFVVMPLMIGQLSIVIIQIFKYQTFYTLGSTLLVFSLWLSTFTQFVPLHNRIASGIYENNTPQKLVNRNWIRTALWTVLFIWSLIQHT